ncbi:hypothetical protein D3C71_2178340 [compost metagenome]
MVMKKAKYRKVSTRPMMVSTGSVPGPAPILPSHTKHTASSISMNLLIQPR